ncbi:MAG: Hpt domain-containing protein [Vibrio sp.]
MEQKATFSIATVVKLVGDDLVEPMLISYQETMQVQLLKLVDIMQIQSVSELHRLVHSMKSSARFIGSEALSDLCFQLEMETIADPQWQVGYAEQIMELCQCSRDVLKAIALYLDQQKASS